MSAHRILPRCTSTIPYRLVLRWPWRRDSRDHTTQWRPETQRHHEDERPVNTAVHGVDTGHRALLDRVPPALFLRVDTSISGDLQQDGSGGHRSRDVPPNGVGVRCAVHQSDAQECRQGFAVGM